MLLDWEGVLADTGATRRDSMLRALADEGVPFDATAYDVYSRGHAVRVAASASVGAACGRTDPTTVELVALRAERTFSARLAQGFSLRPGAREFVNAVQVHAPIVIVTAASRAETDLALQLAGLWDACTAVVTAEDVGHEAPSATQLEVGLTMLGRRRSIRRDRVPVLAHSQPAIRAARDATLRSVAISAPAHVAIEADAARASLHDFGFDELVALSGVANERFA